MEADLALRPFGPEMHALWQQLAALAAVAVAAAWLTARWLIRRRGDCGGACSRCTAAGACEKSGGAISHTHPPRGIRAAGLRVMPSGPDSPSRPLAP